MFDRIIRFLSFCIFKVLAFLSSYTFIIATDNELIQAPKRAARARGVKLRYITEITKENFPYCKRLLDMVDELRHLDRVMGNFITSDSEFIVSLDISPENPITEVFYSNVDRVVKLNHYVFETFWNYAMPAEIKISQREAGHDSIHGSSAY